MSVPEFRPSKKLCKRSQSLLRQLSRLRGTGVLVELRFRIDWMPKISDVSVDAVEEDGAIIVVKLSLREGTSAEIERKIFHVDDVLLIQIQKP